VKTFVLVIAVFISAGAIFALRAYFRFRPPDSSETGLRALQRGLLLGGLSAAALPFAYAFGFYHPIRVLGIFPYVVCAAAGNIVNLVGLTDCLRELSGQSIFSAILLALLQLVWLWFALSAFMLAR
jgi:hypothetical protein